MKRGKQQRAAVSLQRVERRILQIRGCRVILDSDLAELYGVKTKALNQAVKRNKERFPADFAFPLSPKEIKEVVTNCDHLARLRFSAVRPQAFTEHGAIMAANVLNSPRAIRMSVFVVRAFVRLRHTLASNREVQKKLAELERRIDTHDEALHALVIAIRRLMEPSTEEPKRITGFGKS
ncbi:MAG: ORF6N domain-containing protein [Planctomycetota bacterium]